MSMFLDDAVLEFEGLYVEFDYAFCPTAPDLNGDIYVSGAWLVNPDKTKKDFNITDFLTESQKSELIDQLQEKHEEEACQ